ncbi:hypothetical protein ACQKLX_27970 [Bosea sp. NPDC003192]|uniref:hypothetical protein n=1 Tax=Bosea sp. NPDC003192 TaxID=3390551 RepID=UPI003D047C37
MPRNPDHRGAIKEEFERFERERPIALRSVATQLECWRYLCTLPDCRRAQACVGPGGEHCAPTFLRTCFSDKERATLKEALGLRLAGLSADAAWEEAERRVAWHEGRIEVVPLRGER